MDWLRKNISLINGMLIIVGLIVTVARSYGVSETKVDTLAVSVSRVEGKTDTVIKQNADTSLAIGLLQRDLKSTSDDVTEMKETQRKLSDDLVNLTNRVGVLEQRVNRR